MVFRFGRNPTFRQAPTWMRTSCSSESRWIPNFGGKPIIRGHRLAVEHVLGMLAAGDSIETVLQGYSAAAGANLAGWLRALTVSFVLSSPLASLTVRWSPVW
jgi:hypothetical protein